MREIVFSDPFLDVELESVKIADASEPVEGRVIGGDALPFAEFGLEKCGGLKGIGV